MSSEHEPQTEAPDQRRQAREPAAEAMPAEAESLAPVLEPGLLSPRDPLAHTTGQPLRREAILRAQRHQGNRHVARLIALRQEPAGEATPAATPAMPAAPAGLIVDDGGPGPGPGQMRKTDFLQTIPVEATARTTTLDVPDPRRRWLDQAHHLLAPRPPALPRGGVRHRDPHPAARPP